MYRGTIVVYNCGLFCREIRYTREHVIRRSSWLSFDHASSRSLLDADASWSIRAAFARWMIIDDVNAACKRGIKSERYVCGMHVCMYVCT